jgi:hypothetical protein
MLDIIMDLLKTRIRLQIQPILAIAIWVCIHQEVLLLIKVLVTSTNLKIQNRK